MHWSLRIALTDCLPTRLETSYRSGPTDKTRDTAVAKRTSFWQAKVANENL